MWEDDFEERFVWHTLEDNHQGERMRA